MRSAPLVTALVGLVATALLGACSGSTGSVGGADGGTQGHDGGGGEGGGGSGTFACGPDFCQIGTEFCFEAGGGVQLPDAGSNFTYGCNAIPAQCLAATTCACLEAADAGTNGCPCSEQGPGQFLAACLYP